MYHVLLVDDEDIDLQGLQRFTDWEGLGMTVVAAAHSGYEALEVLERQPVDVMVTDIKMPILSGMELARRALEKRPDLKIVFVSGYEDFHYARQAIEMNAFGYVLKPVNDRELHKILLDMRGRLDEERERSRRETTYRRALPLLKREALHQLLADMPERQQAAELIPSIDLTAISEGGHVALLEPDDLSWKLNEYERAVQTEMTERLMKQVVDFCEERGIESCRMEQHRTALLLPATLVPSELQTLIGVVAASGPLTVTIGVGPAVYRLQELAGSCRKAEEALALKLFLGKGRLIRYNDAREQIVSDSKDLNGILHEMIAAMSNYELVRTDDCISELFVLVAGLDTKLAVYNLFLHIVARLDEYLRTINEDFYTILSIERGNLDILYHFETIHDMQSWIRRRMFAISEHLHMKRQRKNRSLIEEMMSYVDKHLEENVMLRDAAHYFSFSPNHLGQIFYEETGVYFSDYVTRRRLERVCGLLRDPKLKIYEVANQLGYKNLSHFSKQFRDAFGVSPGDYRRQL